MERGGSVSDMMETNSNVWKAHNYRWSELKTTSSELKKTEEEKILHIGDTESYGVCKRSTNTKKGEGGETG